jgi:hypothetical protein
VHLNERTPELRSAERNTPQTIFRVVPSSNSSTVNRFGTRRYCAPYSMIFVSAGRQASTPNGGWEAPAAPVLASFE